MILQLNPFDINSAWVEYFLGTEIFFISFFDFLTVTDDLFN